MSLFMSFMTFMVQGILPAEWPAAPGRCHTFVVTEPEEDFAALFEASIKTKRFQQGQTIEGAIVAIGDEVAFVNVGGKGEATIELDELKTTTAWLRSRSATASRPWSCRPPAGWCSRGNWREAPRPNGTSKRPSAQAFPSKAGRARREGRIRSPRRPTAGLLPNLTDRHPQGYGPGAAHRAGLCVSDHRVQGRGQEPHRLAPLPARRRTAPARG